ncbi:MAG: hypothetical protein WKF84_27065 [Pyrinomonadaceae bacterium]
MSSLRNPQPKEARRIEDFYEVVTFHQSFAYEEFVEGLKPILPGDEEANMMEKADIQYDVVPGVFRRIAERAKVAGKQLVTTLQSIC